MPEAYAAQRSFSSIAALSFWLRFAPRALALFRR
jgi:hypothetical protein